jgi:uncharacterized membrane protein YdbT with pleckstrin-like domain
MASFEKPRPLQETAALVKPRRAHQYNEAIDRKKKEERSEEAQAKRRALEKENCMQFSTILLLLIRGLTGETTLILILLLLIRDPNGGLTLILTRRDRKKDKF